MTKNTLKTLNRLYKNFGDKQFSFEDVKNLCPTNTDPQKVFANLRHKKSLFIRCTQIDNQYVCHLTSKGKKVCEFGFNKTNKIATDPVPNDWLNTLLLNYVIENPYAKGYKDITGKIGINHDDINHAALALQKEGKIKITKVNKIVIKGGKEKIVKKLHFQVLAPNVNPLIVSDNTSNDIREVLNSAEQVEETPVQITHKEQEIKGQLSLFDKTEKAPFKEPSGVFEMPVECPKEIIALAKILNTNPTKVLNEVVKIGYQYLMGKIQVTYKAEKNGE
jgi:hypothetical protein